MTKWDKLLIIFIIAASIIGIKVTANMATNEESMYLVIQLDGKEYKKLIIDSNTKYTTIPIKSDHGYNEVKIEGKKVWMENSDCRDKICEKLGIIEKPNETLVCIPHRLSVKLKTNNSDVDIVSY
ncbi:NusG domain II-containing protein [Anaeromicrobium sediminis]|nr:NusG domain II-containing protein [Anaeromicrobium sediminis]